MSDPRQDRVNAIITESLRGMRAAKRTQRHPCEVTSDRLGDHLTKYADRLSGADRDAFSHVRHLLEEIAEGADRV
jgi:hypothetical protein